MSVTTAEIVNVLTRYRFRFTTEDQLQQGISSALTMAGVTHEREVRLDADSRLDFLLAGGLAIEVKISGHFNRATLIRQLHRYAQNDRVESLLVVSNKFVSEMPWTLNGKPLAEHIILGSML